MGIFEYKLTLTKSFTTNWLSSDLKRDILFKTIKKLLIRYKLMIILWDLDFH